jgi:DNA processing protein
MTGLTYRPAHARALVAPLLGSGSRDPEDVYASAVWTVIAEGGDRVAGALVSALGAVEALRLVLAGGDGRDAIGVEATEWSDAVDRWRPRFVQEELDAPFDLARRNGVGLVVPGDPEWPARLDDLGEHAPLCLWLRGDREALRRLDPSVALVGARAATGYGEHVARELAADLAGRGVAVVSGAAYGIDGVSHRAALDAGGVTAAFLAGGVDRPYPAGHHELVERIARTGVVISEVPCGGAPTKWRFLGRNRLIAAVANATVVVEAGWRSGAINTANHAADLHRPLGAVPGPVTSPASAGCHRLLRAAEKEVRCITCIDDVLELLGGDGLFAMPAGRESVTGASRSGDDRPRTGDRTRVGDALSLRSRRTVDEIARRSGMSVADVQLHLGIMRLEGEAELEAGGWRRTAPSR